MTASLGALEGRIAAAPISWGICEVPGWGYQLEPDRVLTEMRGAGLTATELGPDGFLPGDPAQLVASSAKIRQALGWSPQQESVEAIVSSAWVWHQAHPHGYRN